MSSDLTPRLMQILYRDWKLQHRDEQISGEVILFSSKIHAFINQLGLFVTYHDDPNSPAILWLHLDEFCEQFAINWEELPKDLDPIVRDWHLQTKLVADKWIVFKLNLECHDSELVEIYKTHHPIQEVGRALLLKIAAKNQPINNRPCYVINSLTETSSVVVMPKVKATPPQQVATLTQPHPRDRTISEEENNG